MRAVRLTEWQSDPVVSEIPVPEPSGSEVLVEVAAAGLCRSDIHIMSAAPGVYPYTLPFTLGHETAGRVAALGPGASGVEVGDSVVVYSRWGCGTCWQCANGRDNACARTQRGPHGGGLGRDGGLAEYLLVPSARYLVPAPGLDPVRAAPAHRCRPHLVSRREAVAPPIAARQHRPGAGRGWARAHGDPGPQGDQPGPDRRRRRAQRRAGAGASGGRRRGAVGGRPDARGRPCRDRARRRDGRARLRRQRRDAGARGRIGRPGWRRHVRRPRRRRAAGGARADSVRVHRAHADLGHARRSWPRSWRSPAPARSIPRATCTASTMP